MEKDNLGFRISYKGKHLSNVGLETDGVVTCIFHAVQRIGEAQELYFNAGGLNSKTGEHLDWFSQSLEIGDKIEIEVIDSNFDQPPKIRKPITKEEELEQKIAYFHRLKEELKDYL